MPVCNGDGVYRSEDPADLARYGSYLRGGCFRGDREVDSRCIASSPSETSQGTWYARGDDETIGTRYSVCNHDNLCFGCYMGERDDAREYLCVREYTCR